MIRSSTSRSSKAVCFSRRNTRDGTGRAMVSGVTHFRPVINEILEGNLLTPSRLEEVMKKTKFIKRILNFFMPTKQNFINMEWVRAFTF